MTKTKAYLVTADGMSSYHCVHCGSEEEAIRMTEQDLGYDLEDPEVTEIEYTEVKTGDDELTITLPLVDEIATPALDDEVQRVVLEATGKKYSDYSITSTSLLVTMVKNA